jgi:hypothetical protein
VVLKYADQFDVASQPIIHHQVTMAAFRKAVSLFGPGQPALTAGTTQPQRDALVRSILADPSQGIDTFINFIVGDSTLTTVNDITDAKVDTLLSTAVFDGVAALRSPGL